MRINKLKFFRNIVICVVAFFIVSFILNITPGFKRDKFKNITNIIIMDENLTEQLHNIIYISPNGTIYLSMEDTVNLLNCKAYYEEEGKNIITICGTKVATVSLDNKVLVINGSNIDILEPAIERDGVKYLPVSEMQIVFNINIEYIKENNVVVIDKLNKGIIKADVSDDTDIKFKPRGLSKKVGEIKKGAKVSCFYTTSKGWRLIRTSNGILGYVKANTLDNEYILRQDMKETDDAKIISTTNNTFTIYQDGLKVRVIVENLNNIGETYTTDNLLKNEVLWAKINNNILSEGDEVRLYNSRLEIINSILSKVMKNKISGVIIDFENVNQDTLKLINELLPRLREIGVSTAIKMNSGLNEEDFIKVVDYIVK